jgi:hypothetical protein
MGWLPSSNVTTVETPGSYFILPYENNALGVQALKVLRGTGGNSWLWLEYRQPIGQYDSTLNSQVYTGALVHMQDSTTGTHTHLLDYTPATTSFSDAALTGTWTDPYTNLGLAVTGATSSSLSVNVDYRALTCDTRSQPTVVVTPSNPSVMAGASYTFSVGITNRDPLGCGSSTFTLSSSLPSGWATTFSVPSVTLAPGQSLSLTMKKTVPVAFTPGTYALNAVAADANHNSTGTENITVIASTCINAAPTVTLTPLSAFAFRGTVAKFTLSVKNNEAAPCVSRTFSVSSLVPSGWATAVTPSSLTVATGATGTAAIDKTVPVDAAFGSTTVSATAGDSLHTLTATTTLTVAEQLSSTTLTGHRHVHRNGDQNWRKRRSGLIGNLHRDALQRRDHHRHRRRYVWNRQLELQARTKGFLYDPSLCDVEREHGDERPASVYGAVGSVSATSSPSSVRLGVASTMYCLPHPKYVIGVPDVRPGIFIP